MRKILSALLAIVLIFANISPVIFAAENALTIATPSVNQPKATDIDYPPGEDFVRLKSLIENHFSPKKGYQYNCIANGTLCPNYKYTSITEKAIKLIVLKTYTGNEAFYDRLFQKQDVYTTSRTQDVSLRDTIIARIPSGYQMSNWKNFGFGNSVSSKLLDASFGVDFSENSHAYGMLGAIEQKIREMKRGKCQKLQAKNCYDQNISHIYLPSPEELYNESVYWNRNQVKISTLRDEFEYSIERDPNDSSILNPSPTTEDIPVYSADFLTGTGDYIGYRENAVFIRTLATDYATAITNCRINARGNPDMSTRCTWKGVDVYRYSPTTIPEKIVSNTTYTLRYKKESYTLEEAKMELQKNPANNNVTRDVFNSNNSASSLELSCQSSTEYRVKTECAQVKTTAMMVINALGAYYADRELYPDSIDQLDRSYIPKQDILEEFKKNLEYRNISTPQNPNFEIRYIGKIGENTSSSTGTQSPLKRDYLALLSGSTIPEIPSIFGYIPSDGMTLYVRDPANLIAILNQKSNTSTRLSGVDVSESIRKLMMTFFELENFDQIQSHLKNEMAIVVNNLDATAPDIVVILSEADRAALSPTAQARVVGSKDGFIFIASSKETLERFTGLSPEKSMKNAPDFQYVWTKKSQKIRDAFIFVGDEFFENITTFETYIQHYRKYRDYDRLSSLQDLAWAYSDAFGSAPSSLSDLYTIGLASLTGAAANEYSLADGLVVHSHIGSLKLIKTLPEARYDLSRISRAEIEDYKTNILKYRDIWGASLDPMGIVLNRYGDGMEIDFFMTPIPYMEDRDFQELYQFFAQAGKNNFSFITNPRIRMGLVSFVFGFDVDALQKAIASQKQSQSGFDEFNREILDGKNIFDYIGGEFAFSLGGVDADILDGWNIDKVDLHASIQVKSEEKGKELIDILRTKLLSQFDRSSGDEAEMVRGFLARPLIEEYNGKKIYYVEGLPIPFIGKIGFAYTFIDDFFTIGLNRPTIKKVIDVSLTQDTRKADILDEGSFSSGMLFATLFDGVSMSSQVAALYEKNKVSIPRYMRYADLDISGLDPILSAYYATQDHNRRLAIIQKPFHYTIGALVITGDTQQIYVRFDDQVLATLTGTTLQTWDNLRSEPNFPKDIVSEKGIPLGDLLEYKNAGDLGALAIVSHLDTVMTGSEPIFRNTTFGLSLTSDEIGFTWRVFRQKDTAKGSLLLPQVSKDTLYILLGVTILAIIGGAVGVVVFQRRRHGDPSSGVPVAREPVVPPSIVPDAPMAPPLVDRVDTSPSIVPDAPEYLTVRSDVPVSPPVPQAPQAPAVPQVPSVTQGTPPVPSIDTVPLQSPPATPDIQK